MVGEEKVIGGRIVLVRRAISRRDFLRFGGAGVAGLALMPLVGCGGGGQSETAEGIPDPLTIAVIPTEDTQNVSEAFEPVADYVGEQLGVESELYTATDYSGIIEAMRSGEADVAWLGPLSYVLASDRADAEAIAVQLTEEGGEAPTYQSFFITQADSDVQGLEDLRGRNVSFVDPTSTSGNLFPRQGLTDAGLDPDNDLGQAVFAGGHDASALAVANGDVDAGAVSSNVLRSMLAEGVIEEGRVRTVWESDPIPESPLAVRGDLPTEVKDRIKEVFVGMTPQDVGKEELSPDGAIGYAEVSDSDYDVIRELAQAQGLTSDQLAG